MVFLGLFVVSGSFGASFGDIQDSVNSASNSGGTVNLGSGTYYGLVEDKIVVDNKTNLVIRGTSSSNMATIDGQDVSRAFIVSNDSSVTFRYIQFVNCGGSSVSGSAISSKGKVVIENCIFEDNTGESGGAIFLSENADYSVISDCQFIGNEGKYEGSDGWVEGGAIDIHASSVTIKNTIFRNNLAVDVGGAVNFASGTMGHKLVNCSFSGNSAPSGGAIRTVASSLTMEACVFNSNKGAINGGAIYSSSSNIVIKGCSFTSNSAGNFGGALYLIGSNVVNIGSSSNFESNKAKNGGAIYSTSPMTISSSTFKNNQATSNGGAIYITSSRSTITSSKFTSNAAKFGGAIYNNAPLSISSSDFKSNKATSFGGAIYNNNNLNVSRGSITSNTANYGSGIYNVATLRLVKLSLSKNSENPTGMLLNVKIKAKQGEKLNIQAALIKNNNLKGINGIYTTNTNVFNSGKRIPISNYASKQVISFTISGKTYNIKSGEMGIAKYSIKTAKKNYKIKITVKTSFNKKTFKKSVIVVVKKVNVPTKVTNPVPSNSNKKVTVIDEDMVYINSTFNTNQIKKINSKIISYYNVKTTNNIVDKYYYTVDNTGWYIGKKDSGGKFAWAKTSKPASSGSWYNATYNHMNYKITINNKITPFTDSKSNKPTYFFVTVNKQKTSSDLKPYILNTYNITKTDGTSKLVNIYETATIDIYFTGLGFSSKLKNELIYSDSRVQVNHSDFKNLVTKIFQGKADSGGGIEGVLSHDKKIRTIHKWIKKNMDYLYYKNSHYRSTDVLYRVMNKLNGGNDYANCADQSIFLVTILRTAGVPAHFEHYNSYYPKSGHVGHVWVNAYYTNVKTYKLDTTSPKNDVDVINSWTLSKSSSKMPKMNPKYKIQYMYMGLVNKYRNP
ncbi:MAG: transglutaminase domain-containing protein [Methanobacteriaceae archaeon]